MITPDFRKKMADSWFSYLQIQICKEFEYLENNKVKFNSKILKLGIPVLGICFGHQIISKELGGKVKNSKFREFGLAEVEEVKKSILTKNFFSKGKNNVWMSHADQVTKLPKNFNVLAKSKNSKLCIIENLEKKFFGIQFHPEVSHTNKGKQHN